MDAKKSVLKERSYTQVHLWYGCNKGMVFTEDMRLGKLNGFGTTCKELDLAKKLRYVFVVFFFIDTLGVKEFIVNNSSTMTGKPFQRTFSLSS